MIKKRRTTIELVNGFMAELEYQDAPPCLQLIDILNFTDANSGRNNYLFSFGVYLKKKDESFFEQQLMEINNGMKVPLEPREVKETIIKSLVRKDYIYKCTTSPCLDFCNKKICMTRDFGIGKSEGYFSTIECGKLYQYKSEIPYYEWEIKSQGSSEFKRIRFRSEDEIIKQDMFIKLCMRELLELPSKLKQTEWFKHVNQHLKEAEVVVIDQEDDTSFSVLLKVMIIEFLTGRMLANTIEQIESKRVYYDHETKEYWFRPRDLSEYLFVNKQVKEIGTNELHGKLREMGAVKKRVWTKDRTKQLRITSILSKNLDLLRSELEVNIDLSKYTESP
jgi:hypothetical protein